MRGYGECEPIHEETLAMGERDFRVFRCSWGWCVKCGDDAFRSHTLVEAFEEAWGARLDNSMIRQTLGTMERALNSEHAQRRATVSQVVRFTDPGQLVPGPDQGS
jgi:hypothetical protein